MPRHLLCADATSAPLPVSSEAGDEVLEGAPSAAFAELDGTAGSPGDEARVGIWEMGPGVVRDTEVDEVFVVVAGRGSLSFEDGERVELRPGAVVRLFAGERTTWAVVEPVRKVYVDVTR